MEAKIERVNEALTSYCLYVPRKAMLRRPKASESYKLLPWILLLLVTISALLALMLDLKEEIFVKIGIKDSLERFSYQGSCYKGKKDRIVFLKTHKVRMI